MEVLFDNISLNSGYYSITDLNYENDPIRNVYAYPLSRKRGENIVNTNYKSKTINIKGKIVADNKSDLDDKIDEFMELVGRASKKLDISHGTGYRRFVATKISGGITRVYYQLNYADYEMVFLVPNGVGTSTTQTNVVTNNITNAVSSSIWTVGGSAYPEPTITLSFDTADTISAVSVKVNGDKITLTKTIVANDIIIVDLENQKVTLNGTEEEYTGIFPKFNVGDNPYEIDITSTSHQYDLTLSYFKKFL